MCFNCVHWHSENMDGMTCTVFPDGIPDEITNNTFDHRMPFPGDGGVQFQPHPGKRAKGEDLERVQPLNTAGLELEEGGDGEAAEKGAPMDPRSRIAAIAAKVPSGRGFDCWWNPNGKVQLSWGDWAEQSDVDPVVAAMGEVVGPDNVSTDAEIASPGEDWELLTGERAKQ